jgi:hypothetical protein
MQAPIKPFSIDPLSLHQAYYPVLGKLALNQLEVADQFARLSTACTNPKLSEPLQQLSETTLTSAMQLAGMRLRLTRWMKAQGGLVPWTDLGVADAVS